MDEKIKLTDEEIVKALECCSCDVCSNCCLYGKGGMDECTSKLAKNAFELVNRLRSENEELNKDYIELDLECRELRTELDKELDEHEEFTKKAKAEIERLKDEKYKVEQNLKQCENGYELELHTARFDMNMNRERVAELQKQVEAWKARAKELEKAWEISSSNEEKLQKQVDELTAFKNEAISMSLYGKGRKDGEEVAVKDTAREILDEVSKHYGGAWLVELYKKYGVEG